MLVCEHCKTTFEPKKRGRRKPRFCTPRCQNRQWTAQHSAEQRAIWRAAYERNKEKKKAAVRAYQGLNPQVHKRSYQKYCQTERGILANRQKARSYRARRLGAIGTHNDVEFYDLCEQYGFVCLACGSRDSLTRDHVIPLSKGGSDEITNIQPLCHRCNSGKRDKAIDYRKELSHAA
jgi:5-methylcytosine-specific restriction endonuclease McrA